MRLIYYCYGSAHSSITAAAIHLGRLPATHTPSVDEVLNLTDFDLAHNDSLGNLFYKGKDELGIEVYTIGMGAEREIVRNSLISLIKEANYNPEDFYFVEALAHINRLARIGGALSRRYGLVTWGRKMAAHGICQSYEQLANLVSKTKEEMRKRLEKS